jgi:hypothetical protein
MDGFENKPLPIEDVEGQSDGAETNDTSDEETRLAECSSAMKDNLRNEQIDSDNDGDVDSILQTLDNCEGNEVSKITSIPSRQQTEI